MAYPATSPYRTANRGLPRSSLGNAARAIPRCVIVAAGSATTAYPARYGYRYAIVPVAPSRPG